MHHIYGRHEEEDRDLRNIVMYWRGCRAQLPHRVLYPWLRAYVSRLKAGSVPKESRILKRHLQRLKRVH